MDSFILEHLKGVSRTYAIVIPMLPRGLDAAVGLAYLLMRVVDTFEDDPAISDDVRERLLLAFDEILIRNAIDVPPELAEPRGTLAAERALISVLPELLRRINNLDREYAEPIRACARSMIRGVREMLARSRSRGLPYPANRDSHELRRYCYFVAGVVGEMLCEMMASYLRAPAIAKMRDVAVELGIGLQLVNILKDAVKDSGENRRYLPIAGDGAVATGEIYRAVLNEARQSLEKGLEFVLALPAAAWQLRTFCGLPLAWGALTLASAERSCDEQNPRAARIDRSAVRNSMERFAALASDDSALRGWLLGLLRRPEAV